MEAFPFRGNQSPLHEALKIKDIANPEPERFCIPPGGFCRPGS